MDAVKFLEEYNRMCNAYDDCVGCPMHDKPFCHPHDMTTNNELKNLVIAVEKWSCEHSIVTNDTSDTVSRAAAIDAIDCAVTKEAARWSLQELPSARPEHLIDDDFETIRICLDACKEKLCNQGRWKEAKEYQRIYDRFMAFASAQSEIIKCKECKHWFDIDDGRQLHKMCADICGDWFCADAERRTDDER